MNFILLGACVVPGAVIGNHCTVLDENSILNRESFNPEIPKCQNVVEGHYSFNAKFVTQNLRLYKGSHFNETILFCSIFPIINLLSQVCQNYEP